MTLKGGGDRGVEGDKDANKTGEMLVVVRIAMMCTMPTSLNY